MSKTQRAIKRTLKRLEMAVREGEFYEAQELLTSITNRLCNLGDDASLKQALELCEKSIGDFLDAKQDKFAAQALDSYLSVAQAAGVADDAIFAYVQATSGRFTNAEAHVLFLKHALVRCAHHPRAAILHFHAAQSYKESGDIERCLEQLVFSVADDDDVKVADVLALSLEAIASSEQKSKTLFVQCLRHCANDDHFFAELLNKEAESTSASVMDDADYFQLSKFVTLTLQKDAKPLLAELKRAYASKLDEKISTLWDMVDDMYYGQATSPGSNAGLKNILASLFGGK